MDKKQKIFKLESEITELMFFFNVNNKKNIRFLKRLPMVTFDSIREGINKAIKKRQRAIANLKNKK